MNYYFQFLFWSHWRRLLSFFIYFLSLSLYLSIIWQYKFSHSSEVEKKKLYLCVEYYIFDLQNQSVLLLGSISQLTSLSLLWLIIILCSIWVVCLFVWSSTSTCTSCSVSDLDEFSWSLKEAVVKEKPSKSDWSMSSMKLSSLEAIESTCWRVNCLSKLDVKFIRKTRLKRRLHLSRSNLSKVNVSEKHVLTDLRLSFTLLL